MDSLCLLSYIKRVGMWSSIESNVHVSCQRGHGPDPVLELSGPEQALNDLGPVRGSYLLHDECHGEVFSYTTRSGSSPLLAFLWHSTPCSLTSSPCICPLAFPWMTNSFWPTGDKEQQLIVFWLTFFYRFVIFRRFRWRPPLEEVPSIKWLKTSVCLDVREQRSTYPEWIQRNREALPDSAAQVQTWTSCLILMKPFIQMPEVSWRRERHDLNKGN